MLICLTSCASKIEAENLAKLIIENKLAACIQINPVESYYIWQNNIENETEYKLVIKTKNIFAAKLEEFIKQHHSYDEPQIIFLEASASKTYQQWLENSI